MIHSYPLDPMVPSFVRPAPVRARVRARFWNDRQATRLKVILLIVCLAAAAMLEVPW